FDVAHESAKNDSDIVIINTCGFIENAKQESIDTILAYADAKAQGNIEKLYVTGCLSHRYKDELQSEIPEVDAWFGTLDMPHLLRTVGADYKHELVGERLQTTPKHYAYTKISEGCDRPCSFCAIPLMRGKHVSRPIEIIKKEIQRLKVAHPAQSHQLRSIFNHHCLFSVKCRRLHSCCLVSLPNVAQGN
ncbi:MAG: hypothetical protein EBY22_12590, partial [Gammaproteobacteria bacterium]|nr:hypothetical protein [Gammaproteobacteria bacterium]